MNTIAVIFLFLLLWYIASLSEEEESLRAELTEAQAKVRLYADALRRAAVLYSERHGNATVIFPDAPEQIVWLVDEAQQTHERLRNRSMNLVLSHMIRDALSKENARLRSALSVFAEQKKWAQISAYDGHLEFVWCGEGDPRIEAQAALEEADE